MERRKLGRCEISLPVLGFGCATLGGVFGDINENECIEAVHQAINIGVNYFDTSPYYGIKKSEILLGKCLKDIPRSSYILSTKVGRYGTDEFDYSPEKIERSLQESMERIGVDYFDIVICHDIEFGNLDQVLNETIPTLKRFKNEGKLNYIGISGLPLYIFEYMLERSDDIDLILSYCHFNLMDTTLSKLFPLLKSKNIGIINASITGMGLLTPQGPPNWHPADSEIITVCNQARDYCRENNLNIAELAVLYAITYAENSTEICSTLIGMENSRILLENYETITQKSKNNKEFYLPHIERIIEILSPIKDKTWSSGRLENN